MKSIRIFTLLFCVSVICSFQSFATERVAIATGNWTNPSTWQGGVVPVAGDSVAITDNSGIDITVTINSGTINIDALLIDPNGAGSGLDIDNASSLIVSRGIEIQGTLAASANVNITLGGNWINSGTFSQSTSTVTFNGTGAQSIDMNGSNFNNLTVNKASGTATLSSSLVIDGTLSILSGTLDLGNFTANRSSSGGSMSISNGATLVVGNTFPTSYQTVTLGSTSNVTYNATSTSVVRYSLAANNGGQSITYGNLTITGSSNKSAADSLTISSNITIDGVQFSGGSNKTHRIGGNWTVQNSGIYNSNFTNNTVIFNGSGSQQITGDEFRNLTISKSGGTLTLASNISIKSGNVNVSSGTFNLSAFTLNRTASGGTFTVANGATLQIGGTNAFPTNYTTVTIGSTSTVSYTGGTQTMTALSAGYGNLTLSGSGDKTAAGNFSIGGNLTVTDIAFNGGTTTTTFNGTTTVSTVNTGTINLGTVSITGTLTNSGYTLNVSGDWSKSGTYTTTGSVVFNGGSSQSIGASNFNNVTFSGAGSKNITGDLTITGNWTNSGTISSIANVTFNGTGAQAVDNGGSSFTNLTINKSSGTLTASANMTMSGDFTISGGTFADNAKTIAVAGNWTNSGTYTATGTVNLNGAAQTIAASNFYNLSLSGSGLKTATGSITLLRNLTLTGVDFIDAANTVTFSGTTTLSGTGTLTFNNVSVSGTLNDGGLSYTVTGNWANSGTVTSTGTVSFGGTSTLSGTTNFANVVIMGSSTLTLASSSSLGIGGTFTNSGTFDATTNTPNTTVYNKSGAQTILALTYYTLSLSGSGTKSAGGDITLKNSLTVGGSTTFDGGSSKVIVDGIVTLSGAGTFDFKNIQVNNTKSLSLGALSLNVAGNIVNNGTISPGTSSVTMSGTSVTISGTQTVSVNNMTVSGSVSASTALSIAGNITVDGSVTASTNVTFSGNVTINGSFSASSGTATFNGSSSVLTGTISLVSVTVSGGLTLNQNAQLGISNSLTNSGTIDVGTNTPNTILYNGTTQNITAGGTQYYNLSLSGNGSKTVASSIIINGDLSIANSTTLSDGGRAVTINGNIANSGTYTGNTSGSISFGSSTTLSGAGTYNFNSVVINGTLNAGSSTLSVAKDWTNNGTFTSSGLVALNGSGSQTVSSGNFSSLSVSGSGTKTFSGTYTVTGDLTVNPGPTFQSTGSAFQFSGSSAQTISGATFNDVVINNSSNVNLSSDITVNGTMSLTSGDVITSANTVVLAASATLSETAGNTIIGKVSTSRTLSSNSSNSLGGIGVEITSGNTAPGSTTIVRTTGTASNGGGSYTGNSSIQRYFDITPFLNIGLNISLIYHYDDSELNGETEATLGLWKSSNTGTTWTGLGGSVNTVQNIITVNGLSSFSRFTAADGNNPLQPNAVTVKVFRDADGKSSTTADWVHKTWHIKLYHDSEVGQLVGEIDGDSVLTIDTLSSGSYTAVISDSTGWRRLGSRSNGGSVDSTSLHSRSISISGGTSNEMDFSIFHPGKITVQTFADADGDFLTSGDRSGKQWNMIIYKTSIAPANIHSQIASDSVLVDSTLEDGNYIVVEADSSSYLHIGYVSSDSTSLTTSGQSFISITDGEVKYINFVNKIQLNTITIQNYLDVDNNFATSGLDRSLKTWHLSVYRTNGQLVAQSTPDTSMFTVSNLNPGQSYYARASDSLGWRHMGYVYTLNGDTVLSQQTKADSVLITFSGGGNTALVQFINSNADSGVFLTFKPTADYSRGWGSGAGKVPKIAKKASTKKPKLIIKPTIANLLDTVFAKVYGKNAVRNDMMPSLGSLDVKKFPNGLYLGVPAAIYNAVGKARSDTVVFAFQKDPKSLRLFVDHNLSARGFDGSDKLENWPSIQNPTNPKKATRMKGIIKAKKPNSQNGTNNKLAGALAAVRMNIAMSEALISPAGLKDLVFDDGTGSANPLNGKTLPQVCSFVDSALTFWTAFYFDTSNYYNKTYNGKKVWKRYETGTLYSVLGNALDSINAAFNTDVDTSSFVKTLINSDTANYWYPKIELKKGVGKPLYGITYLKTGKSTPSTYFPHAMVNEPDMFELSQNYPNPFNPTTTIQFYVPTSSVVTLKVYNLLGQEITTLLQNQQVEEGYDEVTFDASRFASGVYFYRFTAVSLESGDGNDVNREITLTKKLTLIK